MLWKLEQSGWKNKWTDTSIRPLADASNYIKLEIESCRLN